MKKILVLLALVVNCIYVYAGTGMLTIINSTGCNYNITMYAQSASISSPPACNDIISNTVTVPAGQTYVWSDPYAFEQGSCTCTPSCSCTFVGWSTIPVSTVCGPCGGGGWGGTYPADWLWGYVSISHATCACGLSASIGIPGCTGGVGYATAKRVEWQQ